MMVDKQPDEPLLPKHLPVIARIIEESQAAQVRAFVNVGTSVVESQNSILIAQQHPQVFASVGLHPTDCNEDWYEEFKKICALLDQKEASKIVAVGETGLDYFHQPYNAQRQKDAFKAHIELAIEHDLPLIVHVRESADDVLLILDDYKQYVRGVNHCFLQEKYVADTFISWGWYLGIDAPITYPKNIRLQEIVAQLPLEHLILETDAPFLPPQQFRGKQNSPLYIPLFTQKIAELKMMPLEKVGEITTQNACKLFGLPERLFK